MGGNALAAAVGPLEGKDGVGKRGQRRTRIYAHRLLRLQAQRLLGAGRNLTHHGQGTLYLRLRGIRILFALCGLFFLVLVAAHPQAPLATNIHGAHRIAIDGRLREAWQGLVGLYLLGAHQTQRVGNTDAHRLRRRRRIRYQRQLVIN